MTEKIEIVLEKVSLIPNTVNSSLVLKFYLFMEEIANQVATRKIILRLLYFSAKNAPNIKFYDIEKKEQICEFLNKRIKPKSDDPDEKWITTWNDYLGRLKFFFRWLYNYKIKKDKENSIIVEDMEQW